MKRIITSALAVIMATALFGCGSSSGETASDAEMNETSKEPEIKEVEITLDNWQDYFEYDYIPVETEAKPGDAVREEDLGKPITTGYDLVLKLKDEYKDKLSTDEISVINFACIIDVYKVRASFDGKTIEFGEIIPYDSPEWEDYNHEVITRDNMFDESLYPNFDFAITDDDTMVQRRTIDKQTYSTEDIVNGMKVRFFYLLRKYERLSDGGIETSLDNDVIFAAYAARSIEWTQFEGKIFIYE